VRIWFTMRRLPEALRSGHSVFTHVNAATTLVWARSRMVLITLSGSLHLAASYSSKQQPFQFLDLRRSIDEEMPAFHPCGRHSPW
jgi:hypothetical protein